VGPTARRSSIRGAVHHQHGLRQSQPAQPPGRSGSPGAGVKVAWIADGLDPNNGNFIAATGHRRSIRPRAATTRTSLATDPTSRRAATKRSSTPTPIAGQGLQHPTTCRLGAQPDPTPATSGSREVAPGASLVGLDVFGDNEVTTESSFLEAINYAVETDHVNVINESFGSDRSPDISAWTRPSSSTTPRSRPASPSRYRRAMRGRSTRSAPRPLTPT